MRRRGRALRRRYGRAVNSFVPKGTPVRVASTHGSERFRGLTGRIDHYVPFGGYYIDLDQPIEDWGDRIIVHQNDLELR